jgi:hypothetical protein
MIIFTAYLLWDRLKQHCTACSENIDLKYLPRFPLGMRGPGLIPDTITFSEK